MSVDTKIQWCDSTINPTMGCDGCELWGVKTKTCYAGKLHAIRAGRPGYAPSFQQVTLFSGRMEKAAGLTDLRGQTRPAKPWLAGLPRLIFVSDMSDALSKAVSFEYLEAEVINALTSDRGKRHHWLWLTKRPERMAEFSAWLEGRNREWPDNLWAGTSLTTQATTPRVDSLLKVGNDRTIRFLSVEPQWEPIDLRKWLPMLDWVIQGGESGKETDIHEFKLEWAHDLRKQCQDAGVPYFLKQLGRHVTWRGQHLKLHDLHGDDWTEWPIKLRRRHMPKIHGRISRSVALQRLPLANVVGVLGVTGISFGIEESNMTDHEVNKNLQELNGHTAGNAEHVALASNPTATSSDFQRPHVLNHQDEFIWDDDDLPHNNYIGLAKRLAEAGDLYRLPNYASGLLLGSAEATIEPEKITSGKRLASVITDRIRVRVMKNGNTRSNTISSNHLATMLNSESFLQEFQAVDAVIKEPNYLPDFSLTKPGYNNGGPGYRYLYTGPNPEVLHSQDAIGKFLNVMEFASNADCTNAVAAALTVMLRNQWHGGKPLIAVTSTKSHGGKDTIIDFACGGTEKVSVSYERTDWALQKAIVAAIKHYMEAGVVNVGNVRQDSQSQFIASAFLERLITDPEPVLYSPGTGDPVKFKNQLVVTLSTNFGSLSEDLLNRALPIHLAPVGDVANRKSPIGNPRFAYLPAARKAIAAELRGMIEKWKEAGKPLDMEVAHPFTEWARKIGGILKVAGFTDFLANYAQRRTVDDPVRKGLGVLGAFSSNTWLTADNWARITRNLGLVKTLIPETDRDTDVSRARGIGIVLTNHRNEKFEAETDDQKLTLKLEKARRRFKTGDEPTTRYRFVVIKEEGIPEDKTATDGTGAAAANNDTSIGNGIVTEFDTQDHQESGAQ